MRNTEDTEREDETHIGDEFTSHVKVISTMLEYAAIRLEAQEVEKLAIAAEHLRIDLDAVWSVDVHGVEPSISFFPKVD